MADGALEGAPTDAGGGAGLGADCGCDAAWFWTTPEFDASVAAGIVAGLWAKTPTDSSKSIEQVHFVERIFLFLSPNQVPEIKSLQSTAKNQYAIWKIT